MEKEIYRHYKGGLYEIIGTALHSETKEEMVVYKPVDSAPILEKNNFWVRSKEMFFEEVEIDGKKVKRFEQVK